MSTDICKVWFGEEKIFVQLNDERIISASIELYPRLKKASPQQRSQYELWNNGKWIHWEGLDEDLSLEGFLKFEAEPTM